jgi:hypothetical protein
VPTRPTLYRCLIISPGDVTAARDALEDVIADWNAHVGATLGARVEAVRWETHAAPEMGDRPQGIINAQLVDTCDLGVAIFWSRLGTPTGTHDSGSVEEIERMLARNAPVSVYFCEANVPQGAMRDDQFARLQKVRERYQGMGLLGTYSETDKLARSFLLHLTRTVAKLLLQDESPTGRAAPSAGTAPRPDVRVKVANVHVLSPYGGEAVRYVQISVENHSPSDFFLQSVYLRISTGGSLWPQRDSATGQTNQPRTIRPGDGYSFFVDPGPLLAQARENGGEITHAVAKDKISREFLSPEGEIEKVLGAASEISA